MRNLIKRILKEQLEGKGENPLSPKEVKLFKYLNEKKHKYKTQSELISFIKSIMPFFGKPESDARFYYEVYTLNYRPEGDYENLTKDEFKNVYTNKQVKTSNVDAYQFASAKIPFKGSNLEGKWGVNQNGDWYYVITSYNWYPIFLYIKDKWYEVSERYSSSTGKQMSKVRPTRYNSGLEDRVTYVTPEEIKKLMNGVSLEDIKTSRVPKFVEKAKNTLVGDSKLFTFDYANPKKVRYTIKDVTEEDGKVKLTVDINKAGPVVDGKMVVSKDSYTPEFMEEVENAIKYSIIRNNYTFLSDENTIFEFNHPNQ